MSQPQSAPRGRLKVFLNYAAGAGKTYRMLEEGRQFGKIVLVPDGQMRHWPDGD